MNSFSIFYLLPLFCVSFAPAQANRDSVCTLAKASVLDSGNQSESRTFDGEDIHLYKSYDATKGKTFFQVEDNSDQKSAQFQMDPRSSVFVEKEITVRSSDINARLTLDEDTSAFYRNVLCLSDYPETLDVVKFTLDEKTSGITAIKVKPEKGTWIFVAVSGNTPRLVFPSNRVKSMSHKIYHEEMSFYIDADKNYSVFVEFDRLTDANTFHEYVVKTASQ